MSEHDWVYICSICNYQYDEAAGDVDFDIAPGTEFVSFPEQWRCPECGCLKEHFALVEN